MRSWSEITFRLRQEAANLRLYARRFHGGPERKAPPIFAMPLPPRDTIAACLKGTAFAAQVNELAEQILARNVPLLGYEIQTGGETHWRRDYIHGQETEPIFFRRIPYLDFKRAGDHKIIWELNRHQHLVALVQAHVLGGREALLHEVFGQLETWLEQNPVCCGINWASALEVAFRALSWMWIHHLAGDRMPEPLASKWLLTLYQHGCYLEHNLSIYFSPNTHLQGEALALHALGILFGVARWRETGAALMRRMIEEHVNPDGGHFEQSSYYHVYALDMFLFHAVLEPVEERYQETLRRMARYLWALAGSGEMPLLGDDDGGRLFYPYGDRSKFARATLATCAALLGDTPSHADARDLHDAAVWWLGDGAVARASSSARESSSFPETGVVTMVDAKAEILATVRAFGRGGAGHSHANALSFVLRHAGEQVLIDPGTYTYISDPAWRNRFRGTAAHNTIRIDGRDQADPAGPFRWANPPETELVSWQASPWRLRARCRYRGLIHERQVIYSDGAVWVIDEITGTGRHKIEQFWHPGGPVERWERDGLQDGSVRLPGGMRMIAAGGCSIEISEGGEFGWRSPVPGLKYSAPVLGVRVETELPCRIAVVFDSRESGGSLHGGSLHLEGDRLTLANGLTPGDRHVLLS